MLSIEEYVWAYRELWRRLQAVSSVDETVTGVAEIRNYHDQRMLDTIAQAGILYMPAEADIFEGLPVEEMGLLSKAGKPILPGRYCIPVTSITGTVLGIVGWLNDEFKYLTTSGRYFSKNQLFYGMEQIHSGTSTEAFVLEGMFDALAVRSCGLEAYATMGITVSGAKSLWYSTMSSWVVGIPDSDKAGQKVIERNSWSVDSYFVWRGSVPYIDDSGNPQKMAIKDIDLFVTIFGQEYTANLLKQVWRERYKSVVVLQI